jgi:hypothetical protein
MNETHSGDIAASYLVWAIFTEMDTSNIDNFFHKLEIGRALRATKSSNGRSCLKLSKTSSLAMLDRRGDCRLKDCLVR